jgi:molybdopterin-containing oxidoreductase family membrane subunit
MATDRISIMGLFASEEKAASAIRELRGSAYILERVHSPIPSHVIARALQLPKSRVGWFTLAGGVTGFFTGFLLAVFTATRWSLIVGGKPVVALVPFFIVGFEFTILFAVFGNVLGVISQARLPRFRMSEGYDPGFSGSRFGVLASCSPDQQGGLSDLLTSQGAEIRPLHRSGTGDPASDDTQAG